MKYTREKDGSPLVPVVDKKVEQETEKQEAELSKGNTEQQAVDAKKVADAAKATGAK